MGTRWVVPADNHGDGQPLPEGRHPLIEVLCAETFDVESRIAAIDMDVFPTTNRGYGSLCDLDLIAGGLTRMKRIRQQPRMMQSKVTTSKACLEVGVSI